MEKTFGSLYMFDCFQMFHLYYSCIPNEVKKEIYRHGFTDYLHDVLSKISYEAEHTNVVFEYSKQDRDLEDSINGYDFLLPEDSATLASVGASLHNCVASYTNKVREKMCRIVYAVKDGKNKLCIEVRGDVVHPQRSDHNRDPKGEEDIVMKLYRKKHNLKFCGNFY